MALVSGFLLLVTVVVIGLFFAAAVAWVGLLVWRVVAGGEGETGLVCGSCGYPTRGLDREDCPECGAKLAGNVVRRRAAVERAKRRWG
ncbi:MAG: hypothetical protein AAF823_03870 [Planctomycetota bacterium]